MTDIKVVIVSPFEKVEGYRYFWVKRVSGWLPTQHCARCLKGPFERFDGDYAPQPNTPAVVTLRGKEQYLYVCGVAQPRDWSANFHAPMRPVDGARFELPMRLGQRLIVEGAELLPIPSLPAGWHGLPTSFTTCRNYQFGAEYFGPDFFNEVDDAN